MGTTKAVLTLVWLIAGYGTISFAKEPKSIKEAIANLVSENEAPVITDTFRITRIRYPDGYDHAKQQKVIEAYTYLLGKGVEAFPELMAENIPLEKFSCVSNSRESSSRRPLTVGAVIFKIIAQNVDAANYEISYEGRGQIPYDHKELRAWLHTRRHYSLKEFQLESIAKLKELQAARLKQPLAAWDKESAEDILAKLQKLETPLQKSGKDEPLIAEGGYRVDEFKEADLQQNIPAGSKVWILKQFPEYKVPK